MNLEKRDIIYIIMGVLIGIIVILFGIFMANRLYEYNCNHISITDAWKNPKCREYFKERIGD